MHDKKGNEPMGIIDWILGLFGKLLAFIDSLTGIYLVTILIFAILAKILLFPMGIKQQKSQIKQAKLRPKEMAIRNKYKGRTDQVTQSKMNEEIMALYQSEGYSPLSGCLPLLLQFPIIIGLYEIIRNPLRYICGISKDTVKAIKDAISALGPDKLEHLASSQIKDGKFSGTEMDMIGVLQDPENFALIEEQMGDKASAIEGLFENLPNFKFFGFDLSVIPTAAFENFSEYWMYLLIPILTFALLYFTMKLTKKLTYQPMQNDSPEMGCSTKIMDFTMPLMSTWIAFIVPSLLGVYWMFNNLLGVAQSWILRKMYPIPVFTDAEYKAAEREYKGKRPEKDQPDSRVQPGKKYVSLHRIDDEDYDEKGNYVPVEKSGKPLGEKNEKGEGSNLIGRPELKDDSRENKKKK